MLLGMPNKPMQPAGPKRSAADRQRRWVDHLMPRTLTLAIRIALVLAGCLLCGTSLMAMAFPDALFSEAAVRNRLAEVAGALCCAGYGLLLALPPRLHVAAPALYRVLVVATAALFVYGLVRAMERGGGITKLVLLFTPSAVAVALVRAESRQPTKTQQLTGAPSGAGS